MKLVRLDNYEIKFEDELLLLKPFRTVYKLDKSKGKTKFMDFLTMLYFVYDPRSDFQYIVDEAERITEVQLANGIELPKRREVEEQCIELYKRMTNTSSQQLLRSTRVAVDKLSRFLEEIDLNERDEKGKAVFSVNSIVSAVKQVPLLAKDVIEAERIVAKEVEESGRARGVTEKKLFEDGISL